MGSEKPNILFLFSDQHNAKAVPWGEHPTRVHAPNLQKLADRGTLFSRAFCQSPRCTPSRVSFLSGQYCLNHGFHGLDGDARDFSAPTLFSRFKEAGYRTGVFGKDHTPAFFWKEDVDRRLVSAPNDPDGKFYIQYLKEKGLFEDRDDNEMKEWAEKGRRGASLDGRPSHLAFEDQIECWATDQAIDFSAEDKNTPFFIWLSFPRPHQAYTPAREFWDMYPEDSLKFPPNADDTLEGKAPMQKQLREEQQAGHFALFEPTDWESMRRRALRGYFGNLSMVDACIGRILNALEKTGQLENTIVVYSSDHGDFAGEHGLLEKQPGICYNAITRIPLVWSWPERIEAGREISELVESVDVMPTLLGLAGLAGCDSCDGVDLSWWLTGNEDLRPKRDFAVTENNLSRTIQDKRYKLTVWPSGFFGPGSEPFLEFYDLEKDPWEEWNRAADPACGEIVNSLKWALYEWVTWKWRPRTKPGPPLKPNHPSNDSSGNPLGPDGRIHPKYFQEFLQAPRDRYPPNL